MHLSRYSAPAPENRTQISAGGARCPLSAVRCPAWKRLTFAWRGVSLKLAINTPLFGFYGHFPPPSSDPVESLVQIRDPISWEVMDMSIYSGGTRFSHTMQSTSWKLINPNSVLPYPRVRTSNQFDGESKPTFLDDHKTQLKGSKVIRKLLPLLGPGGRTAGIDFVCFSTRIDRKREQSQQLR